MPRPWSRHGRRFVQINLEFDDVRRLHEAAPLSWSRYELTAGNGQHLFRQIVGASALKPGTLKNVGWDGGEIVAFRLHLPSRILEHNARDLEKNEPTGIQRGNILGWEQHLADRLDGRPVTIEVRMDSQSILYHTLFLFAGAFTAAVLTLVVLIWWTMRRGRIGTNQSASRSDSRVAVDPNLARIPFAAALLIDSSHPVRSPATAPSTVPPACRRCPSASRGRVPR